MTYKITVTEDDYKRVLNQFKRMLFNKQDAEDVTQRFFLNYMIRGRKQDYRYAVIDFLRENNKFKHKNEEIIDDDFNDIDLDINNLTLAQRFIVALIGIGYKNNEIARIAKCDPSLITQEIIKIKLGKTRPIIEIVKPKVVKKVVKEEKEIVIGMSVYEFIKQSIELMASQGMTNGEMAKVLGYSIRSIRKFRNS